MYFHALYPDGLVGGRRPFHDCSKTASREKNVSIIVRFVSKRPSHATERSIRGLSVFFFFFFKEIIFYSFPRYPQDEITNCSILSYYNSFSTLKVTGIFVGEEYRLNKYKSLESHRIILINSLYIYYFFFFLRV